MLRGKKINFFYMVIVFTFAALLDSATDLNLDKSSAWSQVLVIIDCEEAWEIFRPVGNVGLDGSILQPPLLPPTKKNGEGLEEIAVMVLWCTFSMLLQVAFSSMQILIINIIQNKSDTGSLPNFRTGSRNIHRFWFAARTRGFWILGYKSPFQVGWINWW